MYNPNIKIHSLHLPFLNGGGGGLSLQPNFQKGGLDKTPTFREELLGKKGGGGGDFFMGCCNFHIKSKLKSEIFNDKKS